MKKLLSLIIAIIICIAPLSVAEESAGAWLTNPAAGAAADEAALAAFDKAFSDWEDNWAEPICLFGTQIVAGINYCFLTRVSSDSPESVPYFALAYIYADLEGNAEITDFYSLYWDLDYEGYYEGDYEYDDIYAQTIESYVLYGLDRVDFSFESGDDGVECERFVLENGYISVEMLRIPGGDYGYVEKQTAAEWAVSCYAARELTEVETPAVSGYPAQRFDFDCGSNEDTCRASAIVVYTGSWTFLVTVMSDADAYYGYTDTPADELQSLVEAIIEDLEIVYGHG